LFNNFVKYIRMAVKDSATEQLIRDTAKRLFFAEGRFHATTQEIAEAAGVNRTLVHYYFRSRDFLFDQVFEEAKVQMQKRWEIFYVPDLTFRQKIEAFIDKFMEESLHFP